MNGRRIKHMLLRLSPEEKVAAIGSVVVLASTFMPWFSINSNVIEKGVVESGFAGHLGIIGFVVFLLTGISIFNLVAEHMRIKLPNLGYKKEKISLFLTGESAFLLLLTLAIYTKRSLDFTNSEIRFGLYAALIGSFLAAFATYAQIQKQERKQVRDLFEHPEEQEEEMEMEQEEVLEALSEEEIIEEPQEVIQEALIEEPEQVVSPIIEEVEEELVEAPEVEEVAETSVEEDIEEVAGEILSELEEEAIEEVEPEEVKSNQANYFMKDAGLSEEPHIKVDTESIKPVEATEEKKEEKGETEKVAEGIDFYNDL